LLASWVFVGQRGMSVRGETFAPSSDSATGDAESEPRIPTEDGVLLTYWHASGGCSLSVTRGGGTILLTHLGERGVQLTGARDELDVDAGRVVSWLFADPHAPGDRIGWRYDHLAKRALPVRYRDGALVDGTRYTLDPGGSWTYARHENGVVVETRTLAALAPIVEEVTAEDAAIAQRALAWLTEQVRALACPVSVPFDCRRFSERAAPPILDTTCAGR
jgi:hypothetical protein